MDREHRNSRDDSGLWRTNLLPGSGECIVSRFANQWTSLVESFECPFGYVGRNRRGQINRRRSGACSDPLPAFFAIVSAALTAVTILVLIATWRAIQSQADETRALTVVANARKIAAEYAAAGAKQQTELASQLDLSTVPLVMSESANEPMIRPISSGQP